MQRKLAKRLLRDAWSGDAEAIARAQAFHPGRVDPDAMKLHDAQLVIARGYGFESWAAMAQKIESLTMTPIERFDAAVRAGQAEQVHELLAGHADIRARIDEPRFDFDSPAIHQGKKNLPLVDVLLRHGADINARSAWWAGGFGILESGLTLDEARPLIARGAHVTVWAAAGLGLMDELKELVRADPDVVHARGGDGKTPLHSAANAEIARFLLESGAELEMRDVDHGSTPLQYLINGHVSRTTAARPRRQSRHLRRRRTRRPRSDRALPARGSDMRRRPDRPAAVYGSGRTHLRLDAGLRSHPDRARAQARERRGGPAAAGAGFAEGPLPRCLLVGRW